MNNLDSVGVRNKETLFRANFLITGDPEVLTSEIERIREVQQEINTVYSWRHIYYMLFRMYFQYVDNEVISNKLEKYIGEFKYYYFKHVEADNSTSYLVEKNSIKRCGRSISYTTVRVFLNIYSYKELAKKYYWDDEKELKKLVNL